MAEGIAILARAVGGSMGPNGRTMIFDRGRFNQPVVTKDGVSIAKEIILTDPLMELGRRIAYEAADRTNRSAGDATTCAVILINALVQEGLKHVIARRNVIQLRNGMEIACKAAVEYLNNLTVSVNTQEELCAVATVSSQDKQIGRIVSEIMYAVGKDGTIVTDVKQGTPGMEWERIEGMSIDRGYWSPMFINDSRRVQFNAENVYVLCTDERILTQDQLIPSLLALADFCAKNGKGIPHVLLIAPHFEGSAIDLCLGNKQAGKMVTCLVRAPYYADMMQECLLDIATYTGGKFCSEHYGHVLPRKMGEGKLDDFGFCKRIIVTDEKTTLIGGNGDQKKIDERVVTLKGIVDSLEDKFKNESTRERISRLTSSVGVVRCAALTEIATEELRFRVDDALCAARAAIEEGIIPGGGVGMLRAYQCLQNMGEGLTDDERVGFNIVRDSLLIPATQIANVAGEKGDVITHMILHGNEYSRGSKLSDKLKKKDPRNIGYDITTKEYVDMVSSGIIDPKKAIRCALENAVSVAGTFLTAEGAGIDLPEPTPGKAQ